MQDIKSSTKKWMYESSRFVISLNYAIEINYKVYYLSISTIFRSTRLVSKLSSICFIRSYVSSRYSRSCNINRRISKNDRKLVNSHCDIFYVLINKQTKNVHLILYIFYLYQCMLNYIQVSVKTLLML